MSVVRWAILAFVVMLALFMWSAWALERWGDKGEGARAAAAPTYRCPMHPEVTSSSPGECPICHMDLALVGPDTTAATAHDSHGPIILDDGGALTLYCPMHPDVRSAKPGRCPLCKMALEPIPEDAGLPPLDMAAEVDEPPQGTVPISLALDRVQSIGVRTAVVEEGSASPMLRVTAVVERPEQGTAEVHARTPGFVEAIFVDQTGRAVGAGQPLVSLYSPEILQAENDLLSMRAWTGDGSTPAAARRKLELLGMSPVEIDRVLAKREPIRAFTIGAPRGGYVTKKNVVLGSYVTPEMTLYEIQDLSRVYVVGDVFLRDLPSVPVGTSARFVPAGRSDAESSTIDLIYPLASSEARTRRVRMQLDNRGEHRFAPGEWGTLEIAGAHARSGLTVPRDAIVDTGGQTYVFVVSTTSSGQRFVPRTVKVTPSSASGDRWLVDSGLQAGERVVVGATFLIDSESRLQASLATGTPHTPHNTPDAKAP